MSALNRKRSRNESSSMTSDGGVSSAVSFEELITPNFEELARQFPEFGRAWKHVKRTQEEARNRGEKSSLSSALTQSFSIALTKALLHVHFRLALVHVPVDHLCPPIPNRYFYVSWILKDLLPLLQSTKAFEQSAGDLSSTSRVVLDIGTGPSCIYPLLMASSLPAESSSSQPHVDRIFATEVDPLSVGIAKRNVQGNPRVEPLIRVLQVPPSEAQQQSIVATVTPFYKGPLRVSLEKIPANDAVIVCMTNPPFFGEGGNETSQRRAGDNRLRAPMTVSEGSYPDGEVGFVSDMMVDGLYLYLQQQQHPEQQQHQHAPPGWSSCMCGKKTSWLALKQVSEQLLGCAHVCATEFGPGHMTRWFLAWTFRRPYMRSPLAQQDAWSFLVQLDRGGGGQDADTLNDGPSDQVTCRIQRYCAELSRGWRPLKVSILPTNTLWHKEIVIEEEKGEEEPTDGTGWMGDETLPERIRQILGSVSQAQRNSFLPQEGHFQIVISVKATAQNDQVQVSAQSFSHTRYGKSRVEKIKQQMPGEIGRTNRKWRRKLKQQQQQPEPQAMDIS